MPSPNTPSPTTRFGIFVLIAGVVLVGVLWGILNYLSDTTHPEGSRATTPPPVKTVANDAQKDQQNGAAGSGRAAAVARLNERMSQALAVLRDPNNTNRKAALDALKEALRGEDPKVAVAAIRQFLDGKQDAATGLKFKVGDGHELEDAPTMRTFLMGELGDISLSAKLGDAAEVARATLQTKDSADEWALAMRNLAQADPEGSRAFLASKARELIDYPAWQQQPSGGYLEAFDAVAYAGDPAAIQSLDPLLASQNGTLQRASRVALQRLSALAPEQVASYLNANPSTLADYPNLRADYMGSLNLAAPDQLSQAETYLARTDVTDTEKSKFIGRLGLPAGFVSDTLITPENTMQVPAVEQRVIVNKQAAAWLASGKYPTLQSALQKVIDYTTDTPTGGH